MRWLHLSDLHVGKDDQAQEVALNLIVTAIHEFSESTPFDVVVLTGDLAFSGKPEEYSRLSDLLIAPLKQSKLAREATFISVPGNHDLDCDHALPTPWTHLDQPRRDRFFHLTEDAKRLREPRARAFDAYRRFVKGHGIHGVDPTADSAEMVEVNNVLFLTVVTAFFSDKNVSDREQTPAPLHPIRYLTQKVPPNQRPVFILGHHPWNWFTRDTRDKFKSLLAAESALYLHGHEHHVTTVRQNSGANDG